MELLSDVQTVISKTVRGLMAALTHSVHLFRYLASTCMVSLDIGNDLSACVRTVVQNQ